MLSLNIQKGWFVASTRAPVLTLYSLDNQSQGQYEFGGFTTCPVQLSTFGVAVDGGAVIVESLIPVKVGRSRVGENVV